MKRRRLLFLALPPLVVISLLLSDVRTFSRESTCAYCGVTRQDEVTRRVLCLHLSESSRNPTSQTSPFANDFPEFECQHSWQEFYHPKDALWKSPIIWVPTPDQPFGIMRGSALVGAYNHSPEFRTHLTTFLQQGKISDERVYDLARASCMDGGLCQLGASQFDRQLRQLITQHQE